MSLYNLLNIVIIPSLTLLFSIRNLNLKKKDPPYSYINDNDQIISHFCTFCDRYAALRVQICDPIIKTWLDTIQSKVFSFSQEFRYELINTL